MGELTGFEFLKNIDWAVIVAIIGVTEWVKTFNIKIKNINKFLPVFLCLCYAFFQFKSWGGLLRDWFLLWGIVSLFYDLIIKLIMNIVSKTKTPTQNNNNDSK